MRNLFIISIGLFYSILSQAQQLDSTLIELINKGISKNYNVKLINFESDKAVIDQKLAKSIFIPKLTLNTSYTRLNDDVKLDESTRTLLTGTQKLLIKEFAGIPFNSPLPASIPVQEIPNIQDKDILKSSADVEWILFSGFEALNAIKASKHKQESLKYKGLIEKDKIALNIIETYDKLALLINSEKVLFTTENQLKIQDEYVTKAIENGLAIPLDRKKIEIAKQQLIAKQLQIKHNRLLLIEVLHQLTGESIEKLNKLQPQLQILIEGKDHAEIRNEIKALEAAKAATKYKAKMEKSSFIPKIALKGHYEFLDKSLTLLDPKWYVGIGVKWNVFDGFESSLKSKKTKIDTYKYQEQIKEAKEMISLSILKNELAYESALQNTIIVKKELELSKELYNITIKQFKSGLTSINEVIEAINNVEKANFKLQKSNYGERRAILNLLHAKGILKY